MFEMLIVVFIIGTILALVGPNIARWWMKAEETEIKLKMTNIKSALNEYRMEFGNFPSTRDGLRALVENPHQYDEKYRKAEREGKWPFVAKGEEGITDKLGIEFIYNCPPEKFRDKYRFYEIMWIGKGTEDDPSLHDGA